MTASGTIGKIVVIIGIISAYLVLSGTGSVSGWNDFVTQVSSDPFTDWPGWPTFGGPVVNETSFDKLWFGSVDTTDNCNGGDDLVRNTEGTGGGSLNDFVAPLPRSHCWYLDPTSDVTFTAGTWTVSLDLHESGAGTANVYNVHIFIFPQIYTICNFVGEMTVGFNTTLSCLADSWVVQDAQKLEIAITKTSGTKSLFINYDGSSAMNADSYVDPPISGLEEEGCGWTNVGACLSGTFDWLGRSVLYIGGMLWAVFTGIFAVLAWLASTAIAFFTALISMLGYLSGGAGMPSPVSMFFQIIFIGFLAMIFYMLLSLFRGPEP